MNPGDTPTNVTEALTELPAGTISMLPEVKHTTAFAIFGRSTLSEGVTSADILPND
jgi:hypothetical protein